MTVEVLAGPDERLPSETAPVAAPEASPVAAPEAAPVGAPEASPVAASETAPVGAPEASPESAAPAADAASGAALIRVRELENGIIQVTVPPNKEIAGAEAKVAGAAVRALADGRRVPVVLVITGVMGVSVEARQAYVSSIAASAFAVVGETPVDRVIAHYLLRSKSETIPGRFFTAEAEAVEWLGQYARDH